MSGVHQAVLHDEVIAALAIRPDGRYVDGTYGRGGHARSILAALGAEGRLIVLDRDPDAVAAARAALGADPRVTIIHDEFANLRGHVADLDLLQQIDGILLDLGVSSPQLDTAARGFSFQQSGPLDMRMNPARGESAAAWLARADEDEIARVLREYGEERHARRIARRIVATRGRHPLEDTASLARLIEDCVPGGGPRRKHPATRSFQAIRIHVNRELEQLQQFLESVFDLLRIGGRLLVISFHSLEDRIVKRFFRAESSPRLPRGLPLRDSELAAGVRLKLLGKAVRAGADELAVNPRARSATLRVAERAA